MKLDKRRRIENKTNYNKRLKLLKGKDPRLVIRKSNKYITLQIVESKNALDRVIYFSSTKELLKLGWPKEKKGSLKSLTASYLAGFLLGKKASSLKSRLIVDTGLIPNTNGSRIYAAIKGASDSGLKINYNKEIIPPMEKIEGKSHKLDVLFTKIKGAIK